MNLFNFVITILIGSLGSYFFYKLKIPSSAMLGSLFAIALFNITTNQAFFYPSLRYLIQIASGTIIGSRFRKKDLQKLHLLKIPMFFLLTGIFVYNITFGLLVYNLSNLNIATSLLSVAPGGTSDLTIIAPELGGDAAIIAIIHVCRILVIYILIPILIDKYHIRNIPEKTLITKDRYDMQNYEDKNKHKIVLNLTELTAPLLLASTCGIAFRAIGIKAGMIIGAMFASVLFSCFQREFNIHPTFRKITRIFAGAFVGVKFTKEIFTTAHKLFLPILIMIIGIILLMNILPRIIKKLSKIPYIGCLLASAPGGLQEIILIADDLGREYVPSVAIFQTFRLIFTITTCPIIITIINNLYTSY